MCFNSKNQIQIYLPNLFNSGTRHFSLLMFVHLCTNTYCIKTTLRKTNGISHFDKRSDNDCSSVYETLNECVDYITSRTRFVFQGLDCNIGNSIALNLGRSKLFSDFWKISKYCRNRFTVIKSTQFYLGRILLKNFCTNSPLPSSLH